jgi:hypothetical protein
MINEFQDEYRFLSNFYYSKILYEGIEYPSVEHAFQAAKTLDKELRLFMSKMKSCNDVKGYGRKVDLREDWEQVKLQVMYDLVKIKFTSNNYLKQKLIETENEELIEGNYWNDFYWGICNGKGENHLGKILMKVRKELQ